MRVLQPHNVSTFVEALIELFFHLELVSLLVDEAESKLAPNSLKARPERLVVTGVVRYQDMLCNAHALQFPYVGLEGCQAAFYQVFGTEYCLWDCRQYCLLLFFGLWLLRDYRVNNLHWPSYLRWVNFIIICV